MVVGATADADKSDGAPDVLLNEEIAVIRAVYRGAAMYCLELARVASSCAGSIRVFVLPSASRGRRNSDRPVEGIPN